MRGVLGLIGWLLFLALIGMLVVFFLPVILLILLIQLIFGFRMINVGNWKDRFRRNSRRTSPAAETEPETDFPHVPASEDIIDAEVVDLPDDAEKK